MTKITKTARAAITKIVERSAKYDAATIRITAEGVVTAKIDADKTATHDAARYNVGHVDDMIDSNGSIREGW